MRGNGSPTRGAPGAPANETFSLAVVVSAPDGRWVHESRIPVENIREPNRAKQGKAGQGRLRLAQAAVLPC
jgi:hypothetical protein